MKDNFENKLWDWFDSISIKYKNYEIKKTIFVSKYSQYNKTVLYGNNFNLRKLLATIKWKIKLNLLTSKMPNHKMVIKKNVNSIHKLRNKNLYAINISPNEPKCFLHIGVLAENDNHSLVITTRNDVYNYFDKIKKPVILLNIYNPWKKKNDLKIEIPSKSTENKLDLFSVLLFLKSASLIDLLDIVTNENGLPKTLITLQDYNAFDSVFATYFKGKIPTITLQHGKASISNKNQNNLWKYLISDWMIAFGSRQAEILALSGVDFKKIKVLGSAKYDKYFQKINIQRKNRNRRIIIGVDHMFIEKYSRQIYNLLKALLNSKKIFLISLRFHPAVTKKYRKKFFNRIEKNKLNSSVMIEISDVEDPLEDISKSEIILVSNTTLGMESILLRKPVIEYLLSEKDSNNFGDYRDFVLQASTAKEAEALITKLLDDNNFYSKVVEKQNEFVNSEIMPPPATPRILDFINSLNNNKRSIKNK